MSEELKIISLTFDEQNNLLIYLSCPKIDNYEFVIHNSIQLAHFFSIIYNDNTIVLEYPKLHNKEAILNFFTQYFAEH